MFHLSPFIKFSPKGALAGYGEIVFQGRPMLLDILNLSKQDSHSSLLVIPKLIQLSPERYGEKSISDLIDFLIEQMKKDEESFKCFNNIFNWLPKHLIINKLSLILHSIEQSLLLINISKDIYLLIIKLINSNILLNEKEFEINIYNLILLSLIYTENILESKDSLFKLLKLINYKSSFESIIQNSFKNEFLIKFLPIFIKEMDLIFLDLSLNLINNNINNKILIIKLSLFICCCINNKKGLNKNPQNNLIQFLLNNDDEIKCGILNSFKLFPPII